MTSEELKQKMDDLGRAMREMEDRQTIFNAENRGLEHRIAELKDELKPVFLGMKDGMKSQCLEVRYRKGAEKWDTKWLDGYSVDHPEINRFRKTSEPTVAFLLREEWEDDGR